MGKSKRRGGRAGHTSGQGVGAVSIDVGAARDRIGDLIVAAARDVAASGNLSQPFVVPESRDRMLEMIEREQLPTEVRSSLAGALTGNLERQQMLCIAMIDTWPMLQKCLREVQLAVRNAPWKSVPWADRGEKPTRESETFARDLERLIWSMKPDMTRGLKGFEGTVEELAMGYFIGHQVLEPRWERGREGLWSPKSTKVVPPRYYGYPSFEEGEDRLMFDPDGGRTGSSSFIDFPKHRFLVAVHGGHPGHPAVAAPLRALTGYWLAAVYGLKWFMQYAQLFGIPFRWAEYAAGDATTKSQVVEMMRRIGSEGWAAFPAGTKVNFEESSKGGSSLAQRELIALADEQCSIFILGQNLTSASGEKGARSLGEVHMEVKQEVIKGVCDFVGEILTHQLVPSVVELNYGDSRTDLPGIWAVFEKPKDLKAEAERMAIILNDVGLADSETGVSEAFVYDSIGVPIPAPGEKLFVPAPKPEPVTLGPDGQPLPPKPGERKPGARKPAPPVKEKKPVEAADAGVTWRQFPASSGSLGIPRAEMPQIKSGDRAAMVLFFRARGIGCREEMVQADTLKPTQSEYSPEKAQATATHGGSRAILISEDGHVIDGHHQWWDAVMMGREIKAIRMLAPISRCLMMAHRMPSTTVAASIREDLSDLPEEVRDSPAAKALIKRMEEAMKEGAIIDTDALADLLGAAWINSATDDDGE